MSHMRSNSDNMPSPPATPVWSNSTSNIRSLNVPTFIPPSTPSTSNLSSSSASFKSPITSRSTSLKEHIQVIVRCRPRSKRELAVDEEPCWLIRTEDDSIELVKMKTPSTVHTFHYDNVLMGVDNAQVYNSGIKDLVKSTMMGYNGTVFAYGQTASGKTYTMMGTEKEPGVIPRAVNEVFSYIEEDTTGREYLLRVSYMEIYNEKIKDLLNTMNTSPEIIEDKKGVFVRNLKETMVKTPDEVMDLIAEGERNRHISATDYNEHSSRSHAVFQIVIESRARDMTASKGVRLSQLNLIDLAGSEKVASDVERRKEGGYINKSLLTLGNVISKLTSDEPSSHIPFRNSKLTRILQGALSGNARISVICTINPTLASKDESLNTLRFAQRAKLVKTAPKLTRIMDDSELQKCLVRIAELQFKMQEKTDLEVETRDRLRNLLGLILTSSKEGHTDDKEMHNAFLGLTSEDFMKETTMRDVVARCEEGFSAQIRSHQKQMGKLMFELESLQSNIAIMKTTEAKNKNKIAFKNEQIKLLKDKLKSKASELSSLTEQSKENNKVHLELETAHQQLASLSSPLNSPSPMSFDSLQSELNQCQHELASMTSELDSLRSSLAVYEQSQTDADSHISEADMEVVHVKTAFMEESQQYYERMAENYKQTRNELQQCRDLLALSHPELAELNMILHQSSLLDENRVEWEENKDSSRVQVLLEEYASLKEQNAIYKTMTAMKPDVASLQSKIQDYEQQLDLSKDEVEKYYRQAEELKEEIQKINNTKALYEQCLEQCNEHQQIILKQKEALDSKDTEIIQLCNKNSLLLSSNDNYQKEVTDLNCQLVALTTKLSDTHNDLMSVHTELKQAKEACMKLTDVVVHKDSHIMDLSDEICKLKALRDEYLERATCCNEQLAELNKEITSKNTEINKLSADISLLRDVDTHHNEEIAYLKEELIRLNEEATLLKSTSSIRVSQFEEEVARLNHKATLNDTQFKEEMILLNNEALLQQSIVHTLSDNVASLQSLNRQQEAVIVELQDTVITLNRDISGINTQANKQIGKMEETSDMSHSHSILQPFIYFDKWIVLIIIGIIILTH